MHPLLPNTKDRPSGCGATAEAKPALSRLQTTFPNDPCTQEAPGFPCPTHSAPLQEGVVSLTSLSGFPLRLPDSLPPPVCLTRCLHVSNRMRQIDEFFFERLFQNWGLDCVIADFSFPRSDVTLRRIVGSSTSEMGLGEFPESAAFLLPFLFPSRPSSFCSSYSLERFDSYCIHCPNPFHSLLTDCAQIPSETPRSSLVKKKNTPKKRRTWIDPETAVPIPAMATILTRAHSHPQPPE